ncbi:MAG: 50S ribosomal protein L11 methyltransferase [Marinilabiliales bacterium]|nr:50S ribosomal protein L11 methyltransferase [Marinilabiliales bacterium]
MEYTKVNCQLRENTEIARELLMAALGEIGFESFVETAEGVEAYIPTSAFAPVLLASDELKNNDFFAFDYSTEVIADQNWNEVWEQNYFEPLLIEEKLLIRAPFHTQFPEAPMEIIIQPKMAFGTGNHATTHLMIVAMFDLDLSQKRVLDMGCGSGVLSILASRMGARSITAIDIDEWSYHNTLENCGWNGIDNITAYLGDASLLGAESFEVILANIQRNILLEDMPAYHSVMAPGGQLIMSGFYLKDLEVIRQKAESLGLHFIRHYEKSDWCSALFSLQASTLA